MLLVIFAPYIYKLVHTETTNDISDFKKEIAEFEKGLKKTSKQSYTNRLNKYIDDRYDTLELFYFDPNITSDESFKKLGLTNKQISTINNYRNKGGRFFVKDDFRKIYGIRHYQYLKLKPFILLADKISKKPKPDNKYKTTGTLFYFDPNTASIGDFMRLGLTEKQASTIINYRTKGGTFLKKEDFKKIYAISNEQYKKLEAFIKIKNQTTDIVTTIDYIELNSATYTELVKINGIGNYLANNIIKYREKLGGYINKKQLLEIKNFRESTYNKIINQLTIDKSNIKKININFADIDDLAQHPYLNYKQAKAIEQYRTDNGSYQTVDILSKQKIIPNVIFDKIKPYLVVE
jgi:competence ComEA-like helix-hairpin-helix protein